MIYFIQCGENGPIKIGQSDDPGARLAQLQTANPYELRLLWVYKGDDYSEHDVHCAMAHELIRGEWYRPSQSLFDFVENELSNSYTVDALGGGLYVIESMNGANEISFKGTYIIIVGDDELHIDSDRRVGVVI